MTEQEGASVRWRGEPPRLHAPVMIVAFAGWPDAGEVASRAIRHLIEHLPARKIAEIDSEDFYVFTDSRPISLVVSPGERHLEWPKTEFFVWRNPAEPAADPATIGIAEVGAASDLVLVSAREPNLKWRTYAGNVLAVAMRLGVRLLITLGGTYDSVLHSEPPVISGSSTVPELRARLERLNTTNSGYQGPTSIQSALQLAFAERGVPAGSLWGHAPHYVQGVANTKVAAGLVRTLGRVLRQRFDTAPLDAAALSLDRRVERLLAQDEELAAYVSQLREQVESERQGDSADGTADDGPPALPNPETVLQDLEEFLRRQRPERGDDRPGQSG